jgi:hypothetical protein
MSVLLFVGRVFNSSKTDTNVCPPGGRTGQSRQPVLLRANVRPPDANSLTYSRQSLYGDNAISVHLPYFTYFAATRWREVELPMGSIIIAVSEGVDGYVRRRVDHSGNGFTLRIGYVWP